MNGKWQKPFAQLKRRKEIRFSTLNLRRLVGMMYLTCGVQDARLDKWQIRYIQWRIAKIRRGENGLYWDIEMESDYREWLYAVYPQHDKKPRWPFWKIYLVEYGALENTNLVRILFWSPGMD